MPTYCVTLALSDLPREDQPQPCLIRGEHYPACTGWTLRGKPCKGCLPREATHGFLCEECWEKYLDRLGRLGYLAHHLRSIERSGQALGERVQSSREPKLPVPDSWLAADGLMTAVGAQPIKTRASIDEAGRYVYDVAKRRRDTAIDDVLTREGAVRAVTLITRFKNALARWPDSEVARRPVVHTICPECLAVPLYRVAPEEYGEDMLIDCAKCDWSDDWFLWWETRKPWINAIKKRDEENAKKAKKAA